MPFERKFLGGFEFFWLSGHNKQYAPSFTCTKNVEFVQSLPNICFSFGDSILIRFKIETLTDEIRF